MTKKENNNWKNSVISNKFPSVYQERIRTSYNWLDSKRHDDNAHGLWRIHNNLYDFQDFIHRHPGGSFWLEQTRGTDITEAFEIHHISTMPEHMLSKFKVREAPDPRNITLTMKENGFYKVLKSRVRNELKSIDYQSSRGSDLSHTLLIISTFLSLIASVKFNSTVLMLLSSLLLCWTVIASHNYFHRRDNWRMYAFNLSLMNYKDWRISHALSHHIYTNSFHDLEISMFEPWFCYIPSKYVKTNFQRYGSWFYGPIIYCFIFLQSVIIRISYSINKTNLLSYDDLIGFLLPLSVYLTTDASIFMTLKTWLQVIAGASFAFGVIGLNAAHHHPDILHDGDAVRDDRDWGLFQLDTVIDRSDLKSSDFLVLTHFGHHALHHLFPTLDHSILPKLYPILYKTMTEFETELREFNQLHHIIGQHKQLARIEINKISRDKIK